MKINEHTSDYNLVDKLQKRDLDAFNQIFKRYGDCLFGFALKYLKSKEETEGLVQDVFLKIWEIRKKYKRNLHLNLTFLPLHNICRIFRNIQIHLKFIEESEFRENLTFDPEEQMEYNASLEYVNKLIEKLPERTGLVFIADSALLNFSTLHYRTQDLNKANYPYQLKVRSETIITIDAANTGLGSAACDPKPLNKYQLKNDKISFQYEIKPY